MIDNMFNISEIIAGFFTKSNTEEERARLKEWLDQSDDHLKLFANLSDYQKFEEWEALHANFEKKADWRGIHKAITGRAPIKKVYKTLAKIAAVLLIPLSWHMDPQKQQRYIIKQYRSCSKRSTTPPDPFRRQPCLAEHRYQVYLPARLTKREVLLDGEAYFEVTPALNQPLL